MASTSVSRGFFFTHYREFPALIDGKLNVEEFISASNQLIAVVERLGKTFTPVKYDMQGNVNKIIKHYVYDKNSCLLELMTQELANGKLFAIEGILWLNRAFLFFEVMFEQIVNHLDTDTTDINLNSILSLAYEKSVKKYHNWITQKLFLVIHNLSPSFQDLIKTLEVDNNLSEFLPMLKNLNNSLRTVRCILDEFYISNQLFQDPK